MKSTQDGFVRLFDGLSTKGWHSYGKDRAGAAWEVDDGILYLNVEGKDQEDRGDLVTDREYENFHLKLEWKISKNGNSGIIFIFTKILRDTPRLTIPVLRCRY